MSSPYIISWVSDYLLPRFGITTSEFSGVTFIGSEIAFSSAHIEYRSPSLTADVNVINGKLRYNWDSISRRRFELAQADSLTVDIKLATTKAGAGSSPLVIIPADEIAIPNLRLSIASAAASNMFPATVEAALKLSIAADVSSNSTSVSIDRANISTPQFKLSGGKATFLLTSGKELMVRSVNATASELDAGLILTALKLSLGYQSGKFKIDSGQAGFLGGTLYLDRTVVSLDPQAPNELTLRAENVEIAKLLALYPSERISGDGRVNVRIPVKFEHNQLSLRDGAFNSVDKGYLQAKLMAGELPDQASFAAKALSNLHFENINGTIALTNSGDAKLSIQIQGKNPDLNNDQPINVNLNIEENLPSLIRSLKLARGVFTQ